MSPRKRKEDATYVAVPGIDFLELNTKSQFFYVRKYRAGKGTLFKSTRSKKKGEAKTIGEDMIAAWLGNKTTGRKRVLVEHVCEELLEDCKKKFEALGEDGRPKRRPSTYKKDRSMVPLISRLFGERFIDELEEGMWEDWIEGEGSERGQTMGDVAKYLSLLTKFAFRRKIIARKPSFRDPDSHTNKAVIYDDALIVRFVRHADPVLKQLIIIAAENPLRPHENREMRWEFISFEEDEDGLPSVVLRLPEWFTKTKKPRELQVSPHAAEIYRTRYQYRASSCPVVFPGQYKTDKALSDTGLSKKWRAMLKSAKIKENYLFHWLRHSTYSKLLLDKKLPVQHVSEAGGTSIETLQRRYLKSSHQRTRIVGQALSLELDVKE